MMDTSAIDPKELTSISLIQSDLCEAVMAIAVMAAKGLMTVMP